MKIKRVAAATAVVAAVAGGSAVAVAHGTREDARQAEQAVLEDAAKRLDVTAQELRDALAAAHHARLDAAVKAGELTREQADAIKARRRAEGTVLRLGGRGFGGPGGRGHHGGGPLFDDAAEALGLTRAQLFQRLRDGDTIGEIARAQGKTLAAVKQAVRTAVTQRLDAALRDGRITQAQRDEMLEHLQEHIDRLGEASLRGPFGRRGGGFRGMP